MSYIPDYISIILLGPDAGRHAGKFAWDVSFPDPHSGLDQSGHCDTLAHALLCVSAAMETAVDAGREDNERQRQEILENAQGLAKARFGLPSRELP